MAIKFPGEFTTPLKPDLDETVSFSATAIGGVEKFGEVSVEVDVAGVVDITGDNMTGPLTVAVSTIADKALVLKTTDNDTTSNIFETTDSTDATTSAIDINGNLKIQVFNQSAEPTTAQLPSGYACFWTDTDDSKCYLCYNHGGTVKTVELT